MDYKKMAEDFLKYSFQFKKHHTKQTIERSLRGEIFVMLLLRESTEKITPTQISTEMSISTARIAKLLQGLEDKGLISRNIDASDRRKILVSLTDKGIKKADSHTDLMLSHTMDMLNFLGQKDASELVRIIGRLAERERQENINC